MNPTGKGASKEAADVLCEHYEQLRCYVLEASGIPGQVYGLGVILQKGMLAWTEAVSDHCQTEAAGRQADVHEAYGTLSIVQTRLAGMLAGIMLTHN